MLSKAKCRLDKLSLQIVEEGDLTLGVEDKHLIADASFGRAMEDVPHNIGLEVELHRKGRQMTRAFSPS